MNAMNSLSLQLWAIVQMDNRWNGVVALKPWRKFLQGYIREKTQQLSGSAPWHMPFLIRFVVFNEEKVILSTLHHKTDWYEFKSHDLQWRANSGQNHGLGSYELSKTNWGWSWLERWIVARPWESRVPSRTITPKKVQSRQSSNVGGNVNPLTPKKDVSVKPPLANGKGTTKARRLSYPTAAKPAALEGSIKAEESNNKKERYSVV